MKSSSTYCMKYRKTDTSIACELNTHFAGKTLRTVRKAISEPKFAWLPKKYEIIDSWVISALVANINNLFKKIML